MPRGGARPNSGPSPIWKHGKTKTIRVPIALADRLLEVARIMDEQLYSEPATSSKGRRHEFDTSSFEAALKQCSNDIAAQVPLPKRKFVSRYLNKLIKAILLCLSDR